MTASGAGRRVILVDDEEAVLVALSRSLKRAGYEVSTYTDPAAFLAGARLDPPCCVVLDVHMPGVNGVEIQRRLAALEHPPAIVFMSGLSDIPTSVKAMKAGAVDFLAKPFEMKELLASVEEALARSERGHVERAATAQARALLAKLTPRERQVCELVAKGLRSKEIAETLGAAVKTVNIHRSRILSKLGADTSVELSRLVAQAGKRE